MNRTIRIAAVVAIGIAGFWAVAVGGGPTHAKDEGSCDPSAREAGVATAASAKSGKVLGHFDPAMAGCRFACATQSKFDAKSVIAQPGARQGRLTQCPVSGVVFPVDAKRPRIRVGGDQYVTCCDTCAEKLRKTPRRFVRV